LEKKCLLPQLNVFSIKGVEGALVISLNYRGSCPRKRIYYSAVLYLSRTLRPSHLFRHVRHIAKLYNRWEQARRKTESLMSIL